MRFGTMILLVLALSLPSFAGDGAATGKKPLWQFVFDTAGPDNALDVKGGSLHGPLPKGVGQNYLGWQTSSAKSARITENGETFFRFTVDRVDAGGPQFALSVPELEQGAYYRLTATVRNNSDGMFSAYLREGPAPYKSIGSAVSLESSPSWQTESTVIRFEKPGSGRYSLYFNLAGCGEFDLRAFAIDKSDYANWDAQHRGLAKKNAATIRRPDAKWLNFLPGSCFAFGVPAGWNCRRGVAVVSDDCSGPSGQNALELRPGFGEIATPRLYSAPFQVPDPEKKYTVSFSCKGSGQVVCNGHKFDVTDTWKRCDFPILVSKGEAGAVLEFSSENMFRLDAVQVAPEGEKTWRPAGPSEITLGLPKSEASNARVQFDDEPSRVKYRILGESRDVKLAVTVANIWGDTKEFSVTPTGPNGSFDYMVFPNTPRGQFRIDVRAVRGQVEVSPVAEYVVSRLARPVYWGKDAPNSPFGIHVEPIGYMLTGLKAGGVNWTRLHDAGGNYSLWYHIEPEKGKWRFFDDEIQCYRDNHIMVYGQLGGAPVWASYYGLHGPVTQSSYWIRFCSPTDGHMADFERYAYCMVKHYKGRIHEWCLWNEPWGSFLHKGYDPAKDKYITFDNQGAQYTKIMKAAYSGAKRADPTVVIDGFGTYGSATEFTSQIVDADGYDSCDGLDYHQYTPRLFGFPDDGMQANYDRAFAPVTKRYGSIQKPIVMSEGSPLSNGSDRGKPMQGIYKYVLPWENTDRVNDQADRVVRYVMALRACKVKRVFLYTAHGHTNLTSSSFQLLLGADGYPHATLAALSAFARNAEDATFLEYREMTPGVWLAVFRKADGSTFAVVTGRKRKDVPIQCDVAGARAFDLYGNPLAFPATYNGYLQYITAPCPPERFAARAAR